MSNGYLTFRKYNNIKDKESVSKIVENYTEYIDIVNDDILIVTLDKKVIGVGAFIAKECIVKGIIVSEEYRNKGVGIELFKNVLSKLNGFHANIIVWSDMLNNILDIFNFSKVALSMKCSKYIANKNNIVIMRR